MFDSATRDRLFGYDQAFDHPVTIFITVTAGVALAGGLALILILKKLGRIGPKQYDELMARTKSWFILAPALIVPVLLGAAWVIGGVYVRAGSQADEDSHFTLRRFSGVELTESDRNRTCSDSTSVLSSGAGTTTATVSYH